ncbi:MAG: hypothetical protein GY940_42535 [bacterium]|nr:hypothetical protein [bacterium]
MIIKNNNVLLSIGMISLVIALVLGRFGPDTSIVHFSEGLFMGLSLVLNLAFLIRYRAKKNKDQEQ